MLVQAWRFATPLLTALNLGMAFAHVLELPTKRRYDRAQWTTLQQARRPGR